ncbi:MAG TPA: hypothetical protein VFQ53_35795 [Kofleriaceae bacterium]|nr:hypothetical protein [Kofleriaceae bacterium]
MAWLLVLAITACGREPPTQPAPAGSSSGSGSPPIEGPAPTVVLVGCAPAAPVPGATEGAAKGWYPYAIDPVAPEPVATPVARDVRGALLERLGKIDACFRGTAGSLVAMVRVGGDGKAIARVGGLGKRDIEDCVAGVLAGMTAGAPSQPVELECGFASEGGGPLRITLGSDYDALAVAANQLRYAGKTYAPTDPAPKLDGTRSIVVLADPDAAVPALRGALAWAAPYPTTLVGVTSEAGSPVFAAIATARPPAGTRAIELHVQDGALVACVAGKRLPTTAPLVQAKAVDELLVSAHSTCGSACDELVAVVVDGTLVGKDLIAATSAARRAGHDPVITSASSCR